MSPKILAIIFIGGGILLVFALSGFQITKLFSPGITEEVVVNVKQGSSCIVEASDFQERYLIVLTRKESV
jgi:hypothetical protein